MWDDHTPKTKVMLSELETKIVELYQIAGWTFPSVTHRYLFHNVLMESGLWEVFKAKLPEVIDLVKADGSTDADIERLIEPELEPVRNKFVPLVAFVESSYPSTVNPIGTDKH